MQKLIDKIIKKYLKWCIKNKLIEYVFMMNLLMPVFILMIACILYKQPRAFIKYLTFKNLKKNKIKIKARNLHSNILNCDTPCYSLDQNDFLNRILNFWRILRCILGSAWNSAPLRNYFLNKFQVFIYKTSKKEIEEIFH